MSSHRTWRRRCSSSTQEGCSSSTTRPRSSCIGKPFAELGEIPALEFGAVLELTDARRHSGAPARLTCRASPSSSGDRLTARSSRPATTACAALVDATAYPLVRDDRRACTVSSPCSGRARPRATPDAGPGLGLPRFVGGARAPTRVRYGGNTSCVEVRLESGHTLVLDAGTGMRPLGVADATATAPSELHILLTHLHLDHLQGLGFFRPLFRPGLDVHVWGPASPVQTPRGADRDLPLSTAFPGAAGRHPGPTDLSRRARGAGHHRLGHRSRRQGDASGPDRRVPDRGRQPIARLPARSRALVGCAPRATSRRPG